MHYAYYGLAELADSEVETKKAKRDLHTHLCLFLILCEHQKGEIEEKIKQDDQGVTGVIDLSRQRPES